MVGSEIRFLTRLQTNYDSRKIIIITNKINNMSYNPNSPSNWSWKKAFDEVEKYTNKTEKFQQLAMIITNNENTMFKDLTKDQKDECYHLISQVI